jgi:hypothetical protein
MPQPQKSLKLIDYIISARFRESGPGKLKKVMKQNFEK